MVLVLKESSDMEKAEVLTATCASVFSAEVFLRSPRFPHQEPELQGEKYFGSMGRVI